AEITDRNADPVGLESFHDLCRLLHVARDRGFRQLELEAARVDPERAKRASHFLDQSRLGELTVREIDRQSQFGVAELGEMSQILAGALQDPVAELSDP